MQIASLQIKSPRTPLRLKAVLAHMQIQANQQNRTISISGERTQPLVGEDEQKQTRDMQRRFGKFSHTIVLPKNADPQLISAKYVPSFHVYMHFGLHCLLACIPSLMKPHLYPSSSPADWPCDIM